MGVINFDNPHMVDLKTTRQSVKMEATAFCFSFVFLLFPLILGQNIICPQNCHICEEELVRCDISSCTDPLYGEKVARLEISGYLCDGQKNFLREKGEYKLLHLWNDHCGELPNCQ